MLKSFIFGNRFIFEEKRPSEGEMRRERRGGEEVVVQGAGDALNEASAEPAKDVATAKVENLSLPDAGILHEEYLKKIDSATVDGDRKKLAEAKIGDIRYNSRLLVPRAQNETSKDKVLRIKEETGRRIWAYCDSDDKWYKLNYRRVKDSHEFLIGLGDVILDVGVKKVVVLKKNGTQIIAHRGIVPKIDKNRKSNGRHADRVGFMDENDNYVETYTGDKYRIIDDKPVDKKGGDTTAPRDEERIKKYLEEYEIEEKARGEHQKVYKEEVERESAGFSYYGGGSLIDFRGQDKDKHGNIIKPVSEEYIVKKLNSHRQSEQDGQTILDYAKECCEKFNIPFSIFKEILFLESNFKPDVVSYAGAKGLGQFMPGTWVGEFIKYCRKNNINDEKWGDALNGPDGRSNPYANVFATAWLLKQTQDKFPDFENYSFAEQAIIYYACHNAGRGGGKRFIKALKEGRKIFPGLSDWCNRIAYRAALAEGKDVGEIQKEAAEASNKDHVVMDIALSGFEGASGNGKIDIKKGQNCLFGSSGALGMEKGYGVFGIVGIGPERFYEELNNAWPYIKHLFAGLENSVCIVGLGANGLNSNTEECINRNLEAYAKIVGFLGQEGVPVKVATVQPPDGRGEQVSVFNRKIREIYGDNCVDTAKETTTYDGKAMKPEYRGDDGIHLNASGKKVAQKVLEQSLNKPA